MSRPTARRCRGSTGGATSLSLALLTPLFVVLAFAAVQAALWSHARTEARVIARDTAALVARSGVASADARAAAAAVVATDTDLRGAEVQITSASGVITVRITGDAPGILLGTSAAVDVAAAVPVEEITP